MSSVKTKIDIECPSKCETFNTDIWTLINTSSDAGLKEAVLNGEMNLVKCPHCGELFYYDTHLVYLDAETELLVFLFPKHYKKEHLKWQKKAEKNFASLKKSILKDLHISFNPTVIFGMDKLQEILKKEAELQEETEVIKCLAKELGVEVKKISPCYLRENDLAFVVPFCTKNGKKSVAGGARKILKGHGKLKTLKTLLKKPDILKKIESFL